MGNLEYHIGTDGIYAEPEQYAHVVNLSCLASTTESI